MAKAPLKPDAAAPEPSTALVSQPVAVTNDATSSAAPVADPNEVVEFDVRPGVESIMGKRLKNATTVSMTRHAAQHLLRVGQIAEKGKHPANWAQVQARLDAEAAEAKAKADRDKAAADRAGA
ncbi:hypothetical protein SAMN06297251_12725 [Fulvimarina manganoxydans]|uniref:Uncharacterized protein n=1 Tax=Fulvimarina manganoxydans TaxID=937218 RepID=A0A1W2EJV0_9HYPH|nr:hypothetical protein [Fulvimarina manganoxydans]SMD10019.1 hypothetical protein SAMN06297251_12725 [Fulvimarina manganoxydans]